MQDPVEMILHDFQDPMIALNPTLTHWNPADGTNYAHQNCGKRSLTRAVDAFWKKSWDRCSGEADEGISALLRRMRQRVMIAAQYPASQDFIADELYHSPDVTIQAQILELMCELRENGNSHYADYHDMGGSSRDCRRCACSLCRKSSRIRQALRIF